MSYIIRKTNGVALGTILDGTVDTSKTSLTLVGRNYSNYGQIMTDNLVALLENFAYNISPSNPLSGQLWWDTGNNLLKVYTGEQYKVIGGATASTSAPISITPGDLWWDTLNEQLYIYNGTIPYNVIGWILIGPAYSITRGKSGAIWERILDTTSTFHSVISIYVDNIRTGIVSQDPEFTPAQGQVSGFTTIKTGYNMFAAGKFAGTSTNADRLGSVEAVNYMRTDINNTVSGTLTMINDSGITLGASGDLSLSVDNINAVIANETPLGDMSFLVTTNSSLVRSIFIDGETGLVEVASDPTNILGIATKGYVDNKFIDTELSGVPTAPTASPGSNTNQIATTAFVNQSLNLNQIYQENSFVQVLDSGTGGAISAVVDGQQVLSATQAGVSLRQGATAHTWPQTTSNAAIATTSYVRTAVQRWDGSAKYVSASPPDVNLGANGDFWFQYGV